MLITLSLTVDPDSLTFSRPGRLCACWAPGPLQLNKAAATAGYIVGNTLGWSLYRPHIYWVDLMQYRWA